MANWILFGILIGIFLFSTTVLCWQLVMTILEVRALLKTVHGITEEVQPTLEEVNQILHKTNLVMDEAGETYQNMGKNAKRAQNGMQKIKFKLNNYRASLQTGLQSAVNVYRSGS